MGKLREPGCTVEVPVHAAAAIGTPRIVVFTGALNYSVRKGFVALLDALPGGKFLVVLHSPKRSLHGVLRSQWRHLKRNGWRWIPYEFCDLARRAWERLHPSRRAGAARPGARFDLEHIERDERVTFLEVDDLHAASTLQSIRDFAPDVGLALAAPILKPDLFSIPRLGTLNLHKGKVPEYRGMPPAFWELYQGEREVGCTVHVVEASLDTGPVLRQATIPVHPHSTVTGLRLTLDELGIGMLRDGAVELLSGRATPVPQRPGGTTFRRPTLLQERTLARRMAPPRRDRVRELANDAVLWGYTRVVRPLPRWLLARSSQQRVVVLLYHRVRDDLRDPLTVGIEQFDAQMAWLAHHCPLVDIADVVAGRVARDTRRPAVAVTFDGGSLDNYQHAFPILLRHRIPAAFFVPTERMGDGLERDAPLPDMDWRRLREMHTAGFTIGAACGADFGRVDPLRTRFELREGRDALAEHLSVRNPILACPAGVAKGITAKDRDLVRAEGYAGCLSGDGCNEGKLDPFHVRRTPIHHRLSARAFEASLEGWR